MVDSKIESAALPQNFSFGEATSYTRPTTFIGRVVGSEVRKVSSVEYGDSLKWVITNDLLDVDQIDETTGKRVPREDRINLYNRRGEFAGKGSSLDATVNGIDDKGGFVSLGFTQIKENNDITCIIGKVFEYENRKMRSFTAADGNKVDMYALVPTKQLPDNYVHTGEKRAWTVNRRANTDAAVRGAIQQQAPMSEEDKDVAMANIFHNTDGQMASVAKTLLREFPGSETIDAVEDGSLVASLIEKGLLKQEGDLYVRA